MPATRCGWRDAGARAADDGARAWRAKPTPPPPPRRQARAARVEAHLLARTLAAARALADSDHSAETIARKAMKIAAELCVYTNEELTVESIDL